jgi:hypothetical protein
MYRTTALRIRSPTRLDHGGLLRAGDDLVFGNELLVLVEAQRQDPTPRDQVHCRRSVIETVEQPSRTRTIDAHAAIFTPCMIFIPDAPFR